MIERSRVTVLLTHPVQYFAPWFRYITDECPEIDLTVLYAAAPTAEQQGVGFDASFSWDRDLLEGYRHEIIGGRARRFDSDSFFGIDAREVGSAIAATRPDVVLVTGWHSAVQVRALVACRRLGIPVLYRGDSTLASPGRAFLGPLRRLRTRALLRLFAGFLTVGQRSREYLAEHRAVEPLMFHSPHAVDNEFFSEHAGDGSEARAATRAALGIAPDDFVLLFAGKIVVRKRPFDLLHAAARLGRHVVVMFAGGGALESECRGEAERLGVRTIWRGVLGQAEMARTYPLADCLVLPSDASETWGLVVNEAMACGVPCVVSDTVGCAPDLIVPGRTGETYPLGDIDALTAAIQRIQAAGATGALATACRAQAAAHSYHAATAGLVSACRRLRARRSIVDNPGTPRILALCGSMVLVSGVERMSLEILSAARRRGAAVHAIVNTWESARIVQRLEAIEASWTTGYYWYGLTRRLAPVQWVQMAWDTIATSAGLLDDAWRFRPTHVFVPEFTVALRNAPALLLLRLVGVRVILRHGNAPDQGMFYRAVWRGIIDPLVDLHVSNSAFTSGELLAHGVTRSKCRTILNAAPGRDAAPVPAGVRPDPQRIIYVGQVIPPKGLHVLLEAVAELRRRGVNASLDVVGAMDTWEPATFEGYRARVRERTAAPDLAGHVRFLGHREDVPALLASAAVHCCPSLPEVREGFGLVVVEAKEAGLPSVVFSTGALPELVTHRLDGWVCEQATAKALADGLQYFLADADACRAAGEMARRSAVRFTRDRFVGEWLQVFGVEQPSAVPAAPSLIAPEEQGHAC